MHGAQVIRKLVHHRSGHWGAWHAYSPAVRAEESAWAEDIRARVLAIRTSVALAVEASLTRHAVAAGLLGAQKRDGPAPIGHISDELRSGGLVGQVGELLVKPAAQVLRQ